MVCSIFLSASFFVFLPGYFAGSCFSFEGIKNRKGWVWILLTILVAVSFKIFMLKLIGDSEYFLNHVQENPGLPISADQYSFSASDDEVCFSLKSNRRQIYRNIEWYCYERD